MGSKMLKRFVLSALAVCMTLTQVNVTKVNALNTSVATDVDLVVRNVALSDDEITVLGNGYIKSSESFTYVAPTDVEVENEGLIVVDADNQTVTVKSYEDEQNNIWYPTTVTVTEVGYDDIEVTLTNGTGSFKADRDGREGNNYTVKVVYTYSEEVAVEAQRAIANAPHYLNNGIKALKAIQQTQGELNNLATTYITYLNMLIDGVPLPNGSTVKVKDEATVNAAKSLYKEITDNSTQRLILEDWIEDYTSAPIKQVYLVEEGQAFYDVASYAQERIGIVANSEAIQGIIDNKELFDGIPGYEEFVSSIENLELLMILMRSLNTNLSSALVEENWKILNNTDVLTEEGKKVDFSNMLVAGLETSEHEITSSTLWVDSVELTASVNQCKVIASLEANVIGLDDTTNTVTKLDLISTELFIDDGANLAAIVAAVNNSGLYGSNEYKNWSETYGVDGNNYDITYYVDGNQVTEYELHGAISFTVKFTPKAKGSIVSSSAAEIEASDLAYGYNFTLPKHSDSTKSYTYFVNGKTMLEGSVYRIIGETTIERQESKSNTKQDLLTIISNDTSYPFGTGIAATILGSSAVKDETVQYPIIDNNDAEQLIEFNGLDITAHPYATPVDGMQWIAKSYTVGNVTKDFTTFDGNVAKATLTTEADEVTVNYELKITQADVTDNPSDFDDRLLEAINIPNVLVELTKAQVSALNRLANKINYLDMGSDIADGLTLFNARIEESTRSEEEKAKLISDANTLKSLCFEGKNLEIASYVHSYINQGLISFYEDGVFEKYKEQLQYLKTYLPGIAETDEFKKLLSETAKLPQDKIDGLDSMIDEIVALSKDFGGLRPSTLINKDHEAAPSLLTSIVNAGNVTVPAYINTDLGLTHRVSLTKAAEGKVTVTVKVDFGTKSSGSVSVGTFEKGYVLTQNDVDAIEKEILDQAKTLNTDNKHYELTYTLPKVDTELTTGQEYTGKWTAHTYTVVVPGQDDTTITYEAPSFKLPAPVAGVRYTYNINDKEVVVEAGNPQTYTIEKATEFDQLFSQAGAVLTVTRTEEVIADANIVAFVQALNNSLNTSGTQFALVKDDATGKYAIVFNITTSEAKQVATSLQNFVLALRNGYAYVGLGEQDNAFSSEKLSIQAVINAFLAEEGKFGLDTLMNGDIYKEIKDYDTVVVGSTAGLGSMVLDSRIYLGNSVDVIEHDIPFYITINLPAQAETYLAKVDPYMDINTTGDRLNLVVENMPNKPYQVLLAMMLFTGYADINDVTDVDFQGVVDYITAQSKNIILDDNTTAATLQNTINELGLSYDLSKYANIIDKVLVNFRKIYNQSTITSEARYNDNQEFVGYNSNITTDLAPVLEAAGVGSDLFAMIAEYKNGTVNISLDAGYEIQGIGQSYEAAIFDNSKEGINKVWFTKDLSKETLGNNAIVIITSEITDVVTFTKDAYVDLNGQIVDEIRASGNANVKVFDSAFNDGLVKAIRTNDNAVIKVTGGHYLAIDEANVADGYEVVDTTVMIGDTSTAVKAVESIFYAFEKEGTNVTLTLKPSFVHGITTIDQESAVKYLAVDLALHGGLNYYTASSMTIGGNTIYDTNTEEYKDLIAKIKTLNSKTEIANELLQFINCEGVTALANDILAKLVDFENVSAGTLVSYDITSTAWNLDFYRTDEDYLTAGLTKANADTETLTVVLADDTFADLFKELAKIVTVETGEEATFVKLESLSFDGELHAKFDGGVKVLVDFTNNVEYTKLMGIVLATANSNIKAGLQKYLDTGIKTDFIAAVEATTTAQVIKAIHNVSGKTFAEVLTAAGITLNDTEVERVYNVFAKYLTVASKALTKLDITGGNTKIGAYDSDNDDIYVADKENWHNIDAYVSLNPYADNYKEMEVTVGVDEGTIVAGHNIIDESETKGLITIELDTIDTGITPDMIGPGKVIDIHVAYGHIIDMDFDGSTYINEEVDTNRLFNGATFKVTAEDYAGNKETITILIKILGDVNCNGLIESNDGLTMAKHYLGQEIITNELALWAADVNGNGKIDSNDGLMNAYKYLLGLNSSKYKSHLTEE